MRQQNSNQTWLKILEVLKQNVSSANYKTWFSQISAEFIDGFLVIKTPSAFIKDQLLTKLKPTLEAAILEAVQKAVEVKFVVDPSAFSDKREEDVEELDLYQPLIKQASNNLNPKYSLENFVVGLSNNLAFAAAQAVVQNPGISYNPLFIYGGTGVGKTHLMVGVGSALLKKKPHLKIVYCPLEQFMNDFIQSIQTKKTADFRTKYRFVDLLLVDDIQFISGRDSTQEEFFNTFNALQSKNAQIILTSDRPPNEIEKLEARLASRFQGGLMVDIQQPDFDTRVAILKAKCLERGETVDEASLTAIAENMPTNARELEGKLIQILQSAKLNNISLTPDYVKKVLGTPAASTQKIDYKKVLTTVNQYFKIKMSDLTGPRRKKEMVVPRQMAMYILYEDCRIPYERIGSILGGRDHTTILHGVEKIRQEIQRDREMQRMMIEIKQSLAVDTRG